jgi:hypothetical protein
MSRFTKLQFLCNVVSQNYMFSELSHTITNFVTNLWQYYKYKESVYRKTTYLECAKSIVFLILMRVTYAAL